MSRFDLFRYVVRLSEAHIVSNSCTSAIISNGVMSKKYNKSKADMSVFSICALYALSNLEIRLRDQNAIRAYVAF